MSPNKLNLCSFLPGEGGQLHEWEGQCGPSRVHWQGAGSGCLLLLGLSAVGEAAGEEGEEAEAGAGAVPVVAAAAVLSSVGDLIQ